MGEKAKMVSRIKDVLVLHIKSQILLVGSQDSMQT